MIKKRDELELDGEEVFVPSDTDPKTIASYFWTEGDNYHVKQVQNVEPILKDNAKDRLYSNENWQATKDMKKIASVPLVLWCLWESLGITQDDEALKAALRRHQEVLTTNKSF